MNNKANEGMCDSQHNSAVMPDGKPCPSVMTEAELIQFLRLDTSTSNPRNTLQYYKSLGLLKSARIGKLCLYTQAAVFEFLESVTGTHKKPRFSKKVR